MSKKGILLVNLGTPDSPSVSDVRRYLKEFLLDERVIDIPSLPRNLLVRGIIAPFRAPKSAKSYRKIWTEQGSPLMVYSLRMRDLLQQRLGDNYVVGLAMRYQNPSIKSVLDSFRQQQVSSIKVIPLFPQYASATTGSVFQRVQEEVSKWFTIPNLELINSYYEQPKMIRAFADNARKMNYEKYDHFLFSFHGLPQRQLIKSDDSQYHCLGDKVCCAKITTKNQFCYSAQCNATARAIAKELSIPDENYTVCFQSRLGRAEWTKPYASQVIKELAEKKIKKVLVFSPAFVADCLETIFEIGEEYEEEFKSRGGEVLKLVPSLNDSTLWKDSLEEISLS